MPLLDGESLVLLLFDCGLAHVRVLGFVLFFIPRLFLRHELLELLLLLLTLRLGALLLHLLLPLLQCLLIPGAVLEV